MSNQYFKSIYFNDFPANSSKEKSISVAFSESELPYFERIKELSTSEIKDLIGISSFKEIQLLASSDDRSINQYIKRTIKNALVVEDERKSQYKKKHVTFVDSKNLPFQRWYPYIEGYSKDFVKLIIEEYGIKDGSIYDPFAGTGTTIFASDEVGKSCVYSEVNPLLQFLISSKVQVLKLSNASRIKLAQKVDSICNTLFQDIVELGEDKSLRDSYDLIFNKSKYFPDSTFATVLKLRTYIDLKAVEDPLLSDLISIALLSCLLPISYLKKAGDVRFKNSVEMEKEMQDITHIMPNKLQEIANDIRDFEYKLYNSPRMIVSNAKNIGSVRNVEISGIVTSPPYLNGTNYFRNTKLELWFLRYLKYDGDLRLFRNQVLTSGINDVNKDKSIISMDIAKKSALFNKTLKALEEKTYDSRIPLMAKSYFQEMYCIFRDVKDKLKDSAPVIVDIGDSIFCDVHIQTDDILIELLVELGYEFTGKKVLRKRRSRNKEILTQTIISFKNTCAKKTIIQDAHKKNTSLFWRKEWEKFKTLLPHQQQPFSKRNWGHSKHSLCSYQGKLKPSIAYHLIKTFVPENGSVFDPFSGVGTIPFESALNGIRSYGLDISLPAFYISSAKVSANSRERCLSCIDNLNYFIKSNKCNKEEIRETKVFGFNKKICDYYEHETLLEILLARRFFKLMPPTSSDERLVFSSLLHILHGNRPYALSRNSHPIVPYAPTGDFVYKPLIGKLREKVEKIVDLEMPKNFVPGKIFHHDATTVWPQEIDNLDAVITSPPFFDSTRFYLSNWIRLWFSGWSYSDFQMLPASFLEEKQKKSFIIYENIFRQARERLKKDGAFVLHLGKSSKCDMANELSKISLRWFRKVDLFDESVAHCEAFGIRDIGTVTSHQYLVLS